MGPLLLEVILAKDSLASKTSEMVVNPFRLTRRVPTWSTWSTDPSNDHLARMDLQDRPSGQLGLATRGQKSIYGGNLLVIKYLPFWFHAYPQNRFACIVQPRLLKEVADEKSNVKSQYLGCKTFLPCIAMYVYDFARFELDVLTCNSNPLSTLHREKISEVHTPYPLGVPIQATFMRMNGQLLKFYSCRSMHAAYRRECI